MPPTATSSPPSTSARPTSARCNPAMLGITSSPAIVDNILYVAGGDDAFYALDADTLNVIWRQVARRQLRHRRLLRLVLARRGGRKSDSGHRQQLRQPLPARRASSALDPATGVELNVDATSSPKTASAAACGHRRRSIREHGKIFVTTGSAHSFDDGDSFSMRPPRPRHLRDRRPLETPQRLRRILGWRLGLLADALHRRGRTRARRRRPEGRRLLRVRPQRPRRRPGLGRADRHRRRGSADRAGNAVDRGVRRQDGSTSAAAFRATTSIPPSSARSAPSIPRPARSSGGTRSTVP